MKILLALALFFASIVLANFAARIMNPVESFVFLAISIVIALSAVGVLRKI